MRGASRRWLVVAAALLLRLALDLGAPSALAAAEQKVWRAVGSAERRAIPPAASPLPAAPGPRSGDRQAALFLIAATGAVIVVAVVASALKVRAARRAAARRLQPHAARADDLESLWRTHLSRKRGERGPAA